MSREYNFEFYNPAWADRFKEIKNFVGSVFKEKVVRVEHVGSTSVPGMKAKPIIDAIVVLDPYIVTDIEKDKFQEKEYYFTENRVAENSAIFEKGLQSQKTENIHILPLDHLMIDAMVLSRDYLRNHLERVQQYSKLKDELKEKYPDDYKLYRKGKEAFMAETEKLAYEEYR